ncbi:MarR family winged helix-turn-helix transcriptional regulator [Oceanobacillus sp. CAU 1775]
MNTTFFHQHLQFSRSFKKQLNERLTAIDLFHTQWLVLYCINRMQPVTLVEISNYLDVEKPTISRTVKRLEEQNLIETIPSEDKRERLIRLSLKGEESYKEGQEIVAQYEANLVQTISERDMEITLKTIEKLKEKL